MIFSRGQLLGFAAAVGVVLAVAVVLPQPYEDGVEVDRHTGAPRVMPWRRLAEACRTGDAAATLHLVEALRQELGPAPVLEGLAAMLRAEFAPADPAGAGPRDPAVAAVERLFAADAAAPAAALDARAAAVLRRVDAASPPPAADLLALATAFAAAGRPRAQLRWLQRAFARHSDAPAAADALLAVCIANGRLDAAMQVVAAHRADRTADLAWQRRCAELGAWLGQPEFEAVALERIVQIESIDADRVRLIDLYRHLGTPEHGLPHALAIASGAGELAATEEAARNTLASGYIDDGLGMLRHAAARAADPRPWLRKLADYALQDLQVERSADDLARIADVDPGADTADLEALYRRTDQPERLADLLQRRLAQRPDDAALWREVIALRHALEQRDLAAELEGQRDLALADPARYVATLSPEERAQAVALSRQAVSLTLSGTGDSTIVGETLERLRPFFELAQFRGVAEALLVRYPNDPRAKPMRRELVDLHRTPVEAARAAAALAATYPDDADLVELWVERAVWADLPDAQETARRRLLQLQPDDHANRFALADLLDYRGDRAGAAEHWRVLAGAGGVASPAVPRLIDALFATGAEAEALEWLQRLAADPRATSAQRIAAADELFYRNAYDRAKVLYAAVLEAEPAHPTALLRLGQIHAWTNDSRGARPYFERRLLATDEDAARVRFYLAEALFATGETQRATELQAEALRELEREPDPDFTTRSMMATMLSRLGRRAEAAAAYRELVAASPRDVDLVMDYADVLATTGEIGRAEALLRHADALAPDQPRLLRLHGELAVRRRDHAAADRALSRAIELYGAEAGICSDLGQVRYANGDWQGALRSFEQWLALQSDSVAARRSTHEVRDLLASTGIGEVRWLRIGRDRVVEAIAGGVMPFDGRTWAQVRVGTGHYEGRAAAAPGGEATADTALADVAFGTRFRAFDRLALGASVFAGAEGDVPAGLFAALHVQGDEPFSMLDVRADLNALWTEPAAAAGLGGRRSGVQIEGYRELDSGFWVQGGVGFESLSIDPDGTGRARDGRVDGELSVGVRMLEGDVAVATRFEPWSVPSGPVSPFLLAEPAQTRAWSCNGWLAWQGSRLLDDRELAGLLPVAARDEHLLASLRADHHLAAHFGVAVSGWSGADLRRGEAIWGVEAALTWRPTFGTEVTLVGSRGSELGRADDEAVEQFRLQAVLRW